MPLITEVVSKTPVLAGDQPAVTASMLYNLVECAHRVTLDQFGDPTKQDPISPFIKMLWERGNLFEEEVITNTKAGTSFLDLSGFSGLEKERKTQEAMASKIPLIYSGRIRSGDLLGEPDLLRLEGERYIPGDIKSGRGEEGGLDSDEALCGPTSAVFRHFRKFRTCCWASGLRLGCAR